MMFKYRNLYGYKKKDMLINVLNSKIIGFGLLACLDTLQWVHKYT